MLERIEIKNFQSHKATSFNLRPMVNSMQGNSDCGKSAVLRALNWLIFNPAGDYFISNWAKKGKRISAPCEVTVFVDGHKVTRKRDGDFNGYILDGQIFEATRNSVPEQILKVLGLGEVNIQKQLDAPFLLSMSPGNVSRYVNNLVNLSRIDKWITAINGRTRKLTQDVDENEARVAEAQKTVDSYSWVPMLEKLSEEITKLDARKIYLSACTEEIGNSLVEHSTKSQTLTNFPNVDKALELLNEIPNLVQRSQKLESEKNSLSKEISDYEEKIKIVSELADLEKISKILTEAIALDSKADKIKNKLVVISCEINKYLEIKVPEVPKEIFSLLDKLERYKNVRFRMENSLLELRNDLSNHFKGVTWAKEAEDELKPILEQLNTMVCPMCGRSGIHTPGEEN